MLGASLVVMLPPLVVRDAIDAIDAGASGGRLLNYAIIVLALALLEGALRLYSRMQISGSSRRVEYDIRRDMAEHFMRLDQSFYVRSHTGDLMARCTNDLQRVRDLCGPATLEIGRALTMMSIGFLFMLSIDMRLALITLAYFPVIGLVMGRFRIIVEQKYRAVSDQFGELSNRVQENVSGIRAVKAYAQEESEVATFNSANRELMRRTMSWAMYMGAFWPLMIFAAGASVALVLWFGGREVAEGRLTIGEFVQFNSYVTILTTPLISLGWTLNMFQQGVAALQRVAEVFAAESRIRDPDDPIKLTSPRGEVEFRNVSFAYNDEPVIREINLKIPAGQTLALWALPALARPAWSTCWRVCTTPSKGRCCWTASICVS